MPLRFVTAPGQNPSPFITGRGLTDAEYAVLEALRGPQTYTQRTPNATASAATAAAIHTARDAAGAGTAGNPKIVRIPGGTVSGAVDHSVNYQVWECAEGALTSGRPTVNGSGATIFAGGVNVSSIGSNSLTAADNGIIGGTMTGGLEAALGSGGHGFTLQDMFVRDNWGGIRGKNYWVLTRIDGDWTNDRYWHFDATSAGLGDRGPVLVQHSILRRTAGTTGISMMISHDAQSSSYDGRYVGIAFYNCRLEMGATGDGWFGIEIFRGHGHSIKYSELSGGQVMVSVVGSYGNEFTYDKFTYSGEAWLAMELAGYNSLTPIAGATQPPQVGTIVRYNRAVGAGHFVDSNNGPYGLAIEYDYKDGDGYLIYRDTRTPTPADCIGGDNSVQNNTRVNSADETNSFSDVSGHPSTFANNVSGAGWTP